jgi:cytochrome c-type biogenesis protein
MSIDGTVTDGSLVLALPLAAAAGLVSFLSPCVLPLVPGYLTYVTGLSASEVFDGRRPGGGGCSPGRHCSWPASRWSSSAPAC